MAIRVVQLGSPRAKNEGLRIGTARRPPRGSVKKTMPARISTMSGSLTCRPVKPC
jgi:uncharacterized protein YeaO (DUF488 family)